MREAPVITSASETGSTTRRRYSQDFKRQVVEASFRPGASTAQVARQHGLNGNLLHTWRWHYRRGLLGVVNQDSTLPLGEDLIPVHVSAEAPVNALTGELARGLTIRWDALHMTLQGTIEPATLQALMASLHP